MSSRILIAGSQPVLCEFVRTVLEEGGFCVVGVASDLEDAVEMARRSHPDITVLEASFPGLNSVEIARRIQRAWPQTQILLLAGNADGFAAELVPEGMAGLVDSNDAPEDFIKAVAEVSMRTLQPDRSQRTAPQGRQELSPRQREVLAMIAGAKSTREIAAHFGVSPKTVESHRSSIMEKLDIHDVATLVRFAMRRGLVQQHPPAGADAEVWRSSGNDAARTALHAGSAYAASAGVSGEGMGRTVRNHDGEALESGDRERAVGPLGFAGFRAG